MFSGVHKCSTIDCVINGLKGVNDHDAITFYNHHPRSTTRPNLFKSDNSIKKIATWLRNIRNIPCEDHTKWLLLKERLQILGRVIEVKNNPHCKSALILALNHVEKIYQDIIEKKHIGKCGFSTSNQFIPMAEGGETVLINCHNGTLSCLSNQLKPFPKYREIFARYDQDIVSDFLFCIGNQSVTFWRTKKQMAELAALAKEIGFFPLRDCLTGKLIESMDVKELLKIIKSHDELDDVIVYEAKKRCAELFSNVAKENIQDLDAETVEMICSSNRINASEIQIWQFIRLWKKGQTAEEISKLNLEKCVRFEHTSFGWFDSIFGSSDEHEDFISRSKIDSWLRYLNPEIKGNLPIAALRNVRTPIRNKVSMDTPEMLPSSAICWLRSRLERENDCVKVECFTGKKYWIDKDLVEPSWLEITPFYKCSKEAVEDLILMLYGLPLKYRSFQTLELLNDYGKIAECKEWIQGRIEKEKNLNLEDLKNWLHYVPERFELPREIIKLFNLNLFKLAIDPENIRKIPKGRFLNLMGNFKYYATKHQLLDIVSLYADGVANKEAFYHALGNAMNMGSSRNFCVALLEEKVMTLDKFLAIEELRNKNCPSLNQNISEKIKCYIEHVNLKAEFILTTEENFHHRFRVHFQTEKVYEREEVLLIVDYVDGPPCTLEIHPKHLSEGKNVFKTFFLEGEEIVLRKLSNYLRHFITVDQEGGLSIPLELSFRITPRSY